MASESASASTATGVGSTSAPTIREIIATNRNPNIWKDYNLCIMTDNSQKAQCKHCFHFLSVSSNTTLRNHIAHPHCEAKKAQQNQNPEAGQTSMARDGSVFRILYCMICKREDHRTSDHEMYIASLKRSESYKAQPYQYAYSSKQILKAKAKPFLPCTHCGFNDHRPGDCRNYPECEICGSYDHSTLGYNRVIQIRGGVLAKSF
ncbi:hypothetical protein Tco_0359988 [Tanacetum coccineum]